MSQNDSFDKKINILIVDDRPDGRLTLEAVLLDNPNFRIFSAASGPEAIQVASHYDLALILLDVQMPGMDGFETARQIRKLALTRETPIIFVTAISKETAHVYEGYDCGAVDYIFKPFDPHILKSKVNVFVDLHEKKLQIKQQSKLLLEAEQHERARQLAELELENLRRYRNLADAIPHIVWKTNPEKRADYFNKGWTDYTGLTGDQSSGRGWHSHIESNDLKLLLEAWETARSEKKTFEAEIRIKRGSDDRYYWHLMRGIPEHDSSGELAGWILTCTDIHNRKRAEEALKQQTERLARSNKELEQFAFSASHDLQEPLRKIVIFGDLLKDRGEGLNESGKDYLNRIQIAAQRMSDLIENLLRYSRVVRLDDVLEPVDLNDVLESVLSNLDMQIKDAGVALKLRKLPVVKANRAAMEQLFQNLLSNAIKFRNKQEPMIKVGAEKKEAEWLISVKDNGIGIDPKYFEKIFGVFQRLHTWHEYPGTGIGLAIVKKVIEGLNGRIWCDSIPGKGSTFYFTIPSDRVEGEPDFRGIRFNPLPQQPVLN